VLRYDDRGVGQSSGEFIETDLHDFASDGQAAVDFLLTRDDINPAQVGLLGHSEGGYYAQIIAANPDSNVAFVVLMAGPTVSGVDVLLAQNEDVFGQAGMTPAFIQRRKDFLMELFPLVVNRDFDAAGELTYEYSLEQWENLTEEARSVIGAEDAESYAQIQREAVLDQMSAEWWVSFIEYDPRVDLAAVNVPMLAVFGSLDIQVSPEANVAALETSLDESGNPDVTIITLEDANHLFQAAVTGSIEEYFELELDFTPDFLPTVGEWILEHVDIVVE
jgi:pimeloyl-ACP methyl ester carboxylesterase